MTSVRVRAFAAMALCLVIGAGVAAAQESVLFSFDATDGANPMSSPLIDDRGDLFIAAELGGSMGRGGTIVEVSPIAGGGHSGNVILDFSTGQQLGVGSGPFSTLTSDGKGNLYGTTVEGGGYSSDGGTVFELSPAAGGGWTNRTIYRFSPYTGPIVADGSYPLGKLIFDAHGNLYGTTAAGGANLVPGCLTCRSTDGTVFELSPLSDGSWTEKVLYSFGLTSTDGLYPHAGLVMDSGGNLYGTTEAGGVYAHSIPNYIGGGTVFELSPQPDGSWTEKRLHDFNPSGDGTIPVASLLLDLRGNLYGTTQYGGTANDGIVFELSPEADGAWAEKKLYVFSGSGGGAAPTAELTMDAAGNLYGTTAAGGNGGGTVFKLAPELNGTWTESLLHSFPADATDGLGVFGGIVFDANGNLYGTTERGGTLSAGTVFEIGAGTIAMQPVATTTVLTANPSTNLTAGEPVTLTATVSPVSGSTIPTGSVTFADPAGGSATVPLVAGAAVYNGTVPPAGTYSVYASYSGGPGFVASRSATITATVTAPPL